MDQQHLAPMKPPLMFFSNQRNLPPQPQHTMTRIEASRAGLSVTPNYEYINMISLPHQHQMPAVMRNGLKPSLLHNPMPPIPMNCHQHFQNPLVPQLTPIVLTNRKTTEHFLPPSIESKIINDKSKVIAQDSEIFTNKIKIGAPLPTNKSNVHQDACGYGKCDQNILNPAQRLSVTEHYPNASVPSPQRYLFPVSTFDRHERLIDRCQLNPSSIDTVNSQTISKFGPIGNPYARSHGPKPEHRSYCRSHENELQRNIGCIDGTENCLTIPEKLESFETKGVSASGWNETARHMQNVVDQISLGASIKDTRVTRPPSPVDLSDTDSEYSLPPLDFKDMVFAANSDDYADLFCRIQEVPELAPIRYDNSSDLMFPVVFMRKFLKVLIRKINNFPLIASVKKRCKQDGSFSTGPPKESPNIPQNVEEYMNEALSNYQNSISDVVGSDALDDWWNVLEDGGPATKREEVPKYVSSSYFFDEETNDYLGPLQAGSDHGELVPNTRGRIQFPPLQPPVCAQGSQSSFPHNGQKSTYCFQYQATENMSSHENHAKSEIIQSKFPAPAFPSFEKPGKQAEVPTTTKRKASYTLNPEAPTFNPKWLNGKLIIGNSDPNKSQEIQDVSSGFASETSTESSCAFEEKYATNFTQCKKLKQDVSSNDNSSENEQNTIDLQCKKPVTVRDKSKTHNLKKPRFVKARYTPSKTNSKKSSKSTMFLSRRKANIFTSDDNVSSGSASNSPVQNVCSKSVCGKFSEDATSSGFASIPSSSAIGPLTAVTDGSRVTENSMASAVINRCQDNRFEAVITVTSSPCHSNERQDNDVVSPKLVTNEHRFDKYDARVSDALSATSVGQDSVNVDLKNCTFGDENTKLEDKMA